MKFYNLGVQSVETNFSSSNIHLEFPTDFLETARLKFP